MSYLTLSLLYKYIWCIKFTIRNENHFVSIRNLIPSSIFYFIFSQIFNMVSRPILSLTMNPESYPPPSSLPPLENSSMNPTLSNSHLLPTNLSSPVVIIPASTPSAFSHNPEKLNDKKFLLWKQQVLKAIS